jgi:hypothetical protein
MITFRVPSSGFDQVDLIASAIARLQTLPAH